MSLEPLHPRRFGSESAVAAHWVTRCDGFRVVVGRKQAGIVERTVFDDDPLSPVAFRIRRPQGTRLIPITELEAVEPLSRILYFHQRPGRGASAGRRLSAGAAQLRRSASGTQRAAVSSTRWTGSQLRGHWPTVRGYARAAAAAAAAGLALLGRSIVSVLRFSGRMLLELASLSGARLRSRQVSEAGDGSALPLG